MNEDPGTITGLGHIAGVTPFAALDGQGLSVWGYFMTSDNDRG